MRDDYKFYNDLRFLYIAVAFLSMLFIIASIDIYNGLTYEDPLDFQIKGDSISAQQFYYKIFQKAVQTDLDKGVSEDAIRLKFKYFYGVDDGNS